VSHIPESWSKGDILLFDVEQERNLLTVDTHARRPKKRRHSAKGQSSDPTGAVFSRTADGSRIGRCATKAALHLRCSHTRRTGEQNVVSADTDDGHHPMWSQDGKQLFFIGPGRFVGVTITTQPRFSFGSPVTIPEASRKATPHPA
jgi:hypothetical protein